MAQQKISVSLEPELIEFLDQQGNNRSKFISELLWEKKRSLFLEELAAAYAEQAADPEIEAEMVVWDVAVGDGINA